MKISQLGRVVTGKTPPSTKPQLFGKAHPFITPTDIDSDSRKVPTERFVSDEGARAFKNQMIPKGAVCFVCIGATIGKMCVAPRLSLTNQQINSIIVDDALHDPEFVYYALRYIASGVKRLAGGAATPIISKRVFSEIELLMPFLKEQRRIASILSAYDGLIENNTRRIEILEGIARCIFEQWFVHFQFPGHENVRIIESSLVGSIPETWDVMKLGSALNALEAGVRPKGGIDPHERGVPSIGAENINGLGRYDYAKERFVSEDFFNRMKRGQVCSGDVLLYKDGAHIGRKSMFRDGYPHAKCAVNEHVFILRANDHISPAYLYFWLDQDFMTQNIRALNANAAQPGLNQPGVSGLPLLLPPRTIVSAFTEAVEPTLALLFNLARKNIILRRTRDLLLPKLISGELDVSSLPEPETAVA